MAEPARPDNILTSQQGDFATHTIEARVHGHYVARLNVDARGTLVGFHGYAQNAEKHFAELAGIPGIDGWSVVAVQALHPFYVVKTGEVVASWMTKLDRDLAIADNLAYIRSVVASVSVRRPLVFFGFSQGAAMAYRAAAAIPCDGVIALGGDVAPELVERAVTLPPTLIGRGIRDDWYTAEKFEQDLRFLPEAETCLFDGGHEFSDEFRIAAGQFLARL